jgi:hypothetical protein
VGIFSDLLAGLPIGAGPGSAAYLESAAIRGSIVRVGLDEGLAGNEILRQMSEVGYGMRRQNFYRLVGELKASEAGAGDWAARTLAGEITTADVYELTGGQAGKFMTNVRVTYQALDEAGEVEIGTRTISLLSNDLPDLQERLAAAKSFYDGGPPGDTDTQQFLGAEVTGVYQWTG